MRTTSNKHENVHVVWHEKQATYMFWLLTSVQNLSNRSLLRGLERFQESWTAVWRLSSTLDASSAEVWRNSTVARLAVDTRCSSSVLEGLFELLQLWWACLICGRGWMSTARGLCPTNTRAAWARLHVNIPVDLRHRIQGPELSGSAQYIYILHTLFVLSVYLPF